MTQNNSFPRKKLNNNTEGLPAVSPYEVAYGGQEGRLAAIKAKTSAKSLKILEKQYGWRNKYL